MLKIALSLLRELTQTRFCFFQVGISDIHADPVNFRDREGASQPSKKAKHHPGYPNVAPSNTWDN